MARFHVIIEGATPGGKRVRVRGTRALTDPTEKEWQAEAVHVFTDGFLDEYAVAHKWRVVTSEPLGPGQFRCRFGYTIDQGEQLEEPVIVSLEPG